MITEVINIERAKLIEGWMSDDELLWLAEKACAHKMIVEVGSFIGRSTRAMADNTNGTVIAIDPWNRDWYKDKDYPVKNVDSEAFEVASRHNQYTEFYDNLLDHIRSNKVLMFRGTFRSVACIPDMVFIDGNHTYEYVKSDILYALATISGDGLICGHDYGGIWPDVKKAVDELIPEPKFGPGSIWFYER